MAFQHLNRHFKIPSEKTRLGERRRKRLEEVVCFKVRPKQSRTVSRGWESKVLVGVMA